MALTQSTLIHGESRASFDAHVCRAGAAFAGED